MQFNPGAASFTVGGNSIALTGDIVNNSSNAQTINLALAITPTTSVNTGAQDMTINGNISGTGGVLTKTGNGTLFLTGTNTQTGGTAINQGTVSVGTGTALGGAGASVRFGGGTLSASAAFTSAVGLNIGVSGGAFNDNGHNVTFQGNTSGSGNLTKTGGTLSLTGSSSMTGTINLTEGDLSGTASSLGNVALSNGTNVTFNQTVDGSYGKLISGTGSMTKDGAGNLTINNQQTYSGATNVVAGTLKLQGAPPAGTSFFGAQTDVGGGWRTAAQTKTCDIDGNNILGTDGYWLVGDNGSQSIPTYTNNWVQTGSIYGGNGSFFPVDNPANPGTTTTPGTTATGNGSDVFSFQMTGTAPTKMIRVGLMIDALDNAFFNPSSLSILKKGVVQNTQDVSGAENTAPYNNKNPDWLFWDIVGATVWRYIQVSRNVSTKRPGDHHRLRLRFNQPGAQRYSPRHDACFRRGWRDP